MVCATISKSRALVRLASTGPLLAEETLHVQNRKLDHFRPDASTVISGMVARTSHATLGKWRSGRSLTYLSPQDTNFVYIRPWVTEFERQNKQVTINNNESLL